MTSVASDEVEFEALATSVIKRLHAAFKAKESLASTPQLWRAVSIEHQLFQHTNASGGHRRTHDFRHDAALVQVYEQTAADLIGYVERKRDFHNWETLTKHQRAGQMKSAFREYLTERGLVRPSKKPKKAKVTRQVRIPSMDFGGAAAGAATAPRVNKKTMGAYVGRTVALVGAVESHTPTAVVLRTSDGEIVNVKPQPGSNYGSKMVEVIGRVVDTETIQEFKATLFGDDFDLENYDQLVQLAQTKFRQLFE
ncbi:hypothetical protein BBJ28_00002281 [Nothophytophthora sp. Chile5]|nr:hypothetical protein BBJ28_00002281 [Nothophytophthora sp. Chile5]